jgi:hypothetical protein
MPTFVQLSLSNLIAESLAPVTLQDAHFVTLILFVLATCMVCQAERRGIVDVCWRPAAPAYIVHLDLLNRIEFGEIVGMELLLVCTDVIGRRQNQFGCANIDANEAIHLVDIVCPIVLESAA